MATLRPSEEARRLGRLIYLVSAVAIGSHTFGVSLEMTEPVSVHIPAEFPFAGVCALVVAFLGISLIARSVDDVADYLQIRAATLHLASLEPPVQEEELRQYPPDLEHRVRASLIRVAPRFRKWASGLIFVLDAGLPAMIAVFVVVSLWDSVRNIF